MSTSNIPNVILVDDKTEELRPLAEVVAGKGATRCRVLAPDDISNQDLQSADLVIVDFTLDEWLGSVSPEPISLRPPNGIALAALFRQYSDESKKAPPTGYALITGKGEALGPLPHERRPHVISRLNNLEWFFEKQARAEDNARQIIELSKAIQSLPKDVKQELREVNALVKFLGVQGTDPLFERYCDSVSRCRPPIHHLSERSHGLVIIRWLLHRILPHTCFLFDWLHLSARLRVKPESMKKCLSEENPLAKALDTVKYLGPLANFDGPRWWRSGVEQWLWDGTNGESANDPAVLDYLRSLGCKHLTVTGLTSPVVTVDRELLEEQSLSSYQDVIPLRLDDWPDYAEPAYAKKETLEQNPDMKMFVARK
jgi:hypothetical protein